MTAPERPSGGWLLSDQTIAALTEWVDLLRSIQARVDLERREVYHSDDNEKLKTKEREGDM